MSYVDGYVIPLQRKNLPAYRTMAEEGRDIWMKHGALNYFECVGEDLNPDTGEMGEILPFPKLVNAQPDETVIFAFVIYKSREHRDEVVAKVNAEMSEKYKNQEDFVMPFDSERVTYGGFETIVEG